MFSCGALPRSRDRGLPLGLATATVQRAGRSIPSQPPLLLARGERRSARDTQRSQTQRVRKQARAFWWSARSALGAPGLVTVQSDNPVTEYVAPAPLSSFAPPPDVTCAALAPLTDYMAPAPVIGYIAPARAALCFPDFSKASTQRVVGSLLRSERTAAPVFSKVHQEETVAVETTQNIVTPVQYAAPTMTVTRVDLNRNSTPDLLQQPQFEHMDTMTVTVADMNRNDIPDFLQQPQFGLAPQVMLLLCCTELQ